MLLHFKGCAIVNCSLSCLYVVMSSSSNDQCGFSVFSTVKVSWAHIKADSGTWQSDDVKTSICRETRRPSCMSRLEFKPAIRMSESLIQEATFYWVIVITQQPQHVKRQGPESHLTHWKPFFPVPAWGPLQKAPKDVLQSVQPFATSPYIRTRILSKKGLYVVDWSHLHQVEGRCWTLVNTVIKPSSSIYIEAFR